MSVNSKKCKYCNQPVVDITAEGLQCKSCFKHVHVDCLRKKCVPGGLLGDVFFTFTCMDCSQSDAEVFERDKITWLQAIATALFNLQSRSSGLARHGYFHWKTCIASFIDKNWDVLFRKDFAKKKKWMGTIAGTLSTYSPQFFRSGTTVFNEQGWWTLSYPKLTPNTVFQINAWLMLEKQKVKDGNKSPTEVERMHHLLVEKGYYDEEELATFELNLRNAAPDNSTTAITKKTEKEQAKRLLPTLEKYSECPKKLLKLADNSLGVIKSESESRRLSNPPQTSKTKTLLDPMCHYNTSLKNLANFKGEPLKIKLLGRVREDLLLSPYSSLYLKPYIRRDTTVFPSWLRLMAEMQMVANKNHPDFVLPPRGPLDFVYVQPEHIPAVNSLCNQFFWPGIDLTECLQYPDFSCVVLYRQLVVAFAFVVPDVKVSENYVSFIFTRPHWRNCGIAKYMLYHLIQTSVGKDLTIHVSVNNPALILYQKFGFKVEHVALDFYDKYIRHDATESKHAFFCRLER